MNMFLIPVARHAAPGQYPTSVFLRTRLVPSCPWDVYMILSYTEFVILSVVMCRVTLQRAVLFRNVRIIIIIVAGRFRTKTSM